MTPDKAFECLLVSHDPALFSTMDRILRDLSVSTSVCLSPSKAINLLEEKTDLFVIDWEGEVSWDLLHEIWKLRSRRKPTVVAVSTQDGLIPGVHVVIRKPVTTDSGTKMLRTAYSRMLLDHRRHARHVVMTQVQATSDSGVTFPMTITNIGDGGVGLNTAKTLVAGEVLSFRLSLYGAQKDIYIQARVVWMGDRGRAGCEFVRIPPIDRNILHDWLTSKIQVKKPLIAV